MRTSIASTLSVAGVVAAGVAAFALNTAVLTTGSSGTGEGAAPTSTAGGELSAPAGAVSQSGSGTATVGQVPVTAGSTVVSATLTAYRVGEAGTVVVDTTDGTVTVANILPAAGWTSEPARTDPDGTVKVHFVKGSARIEFVARMTQGSVDVKVVNETPAVTSPANSGGTPATTPGTVTSRPREHHDDDDDREEHDDEDRHEWEDDDDD